MRPGKGFGMKRGMTVALIAAAMVIVCGGIAGAHRASYATTVVEDGASRSPRPDFKVTGHLESPKDACVRNRTVKFLARSEDGIAVLLDQDRTNNRGKWKLMATSRTPTTSGSRRPRRGSPSATITVASARRARSPVLF